MNLNISFSEEVKSKKSSIELFLIKFCRYLLSGIKRKGSDEHHLNEGLMMGNRTIELNKAKRNAAIVNDEISTIRSQQEELEKLGKTIYTQNTQLLNENKLLWEELNKNK